MGMEGGYIYICWSLGSEQLFVMIYQTKLDYIFLPKEEKYGKIVHYSLLISPVFSDE